MAGEADSIMVTVADILMEAGISVVAVAILEEADTWAAVMAGADIAKEPIVI